MNKRYTTGQIAELLGFTNQYIRVTARRLKIEPTKENNSFIYTEKDLKQIADALGIDLEKQENKENALELEIKLLKERIEEKDNQISDLREQVKSLLDTNKALAFALAGNTQKELIEPKQESNNDIKPIEQVETIEKPKKKGLLERFKHWLVSS